MGRFQKGVVIMIIFFLTIIVGEVVFLSSIKPKLTCSTPVKPSEYSNKIEDQSKIDKIIAIYMSSHTSSFAEGKIESSMSCYVTEELKKDINGTIIVSIKSAFNNSQSNQILKFIDKQATFIDPKKNLILYNDIKKGDLLNITYVYNYKTDSTSVEVNKVK